MMRLDFSRFWQHGHERHTAQLRLGLLLCGWLLFKQADAIAAIAKAVACAGACRARHAVVALEEECEIGLLPLTSAPRTTVPFAQVALERVLVGVASWEECM